MWNNKIIVINFVVFCLITTNQIFLPWKSNQPKVKITNPKKKTSLVKKIYMFYKSETKIYK